MPIKGQGFELTGYAGASEVMRWEESGYPNPDVQRDIFRCPRETRVCRDSYNPRMSITRRAR